MFTSAILETITGGGKSAARGRHTHFVTSMFQNTGAGAIRSP